MKIQRQKTTNQGRRGTALVEMALVLPIFIAVTLGIVEFGRAMMVGQLITNAAREGARLGIIDGSTNAEVVTSVQQFLQQAAGRSRKGRIGHRADAGSKAGRDARRNGRSSQRRTGPRQHIHGSAAFGQVPFAVPNCRFRVRAGTKPADPRRG